MTGAREAAEVRVVGLAQIDVEPGEPEANVEKSVDHVERLSGSGAELVVLPELTDVGYLMDPTRLATALDRSEGGAGSIAAWCEVAERTGTAVVAGFAEGEGGRAYNAAVVIDASGVLVGRYRKLHLFDRERELFAPGDLGLPVFDVDGIRVGALICYDLRFPEALRILALQDADVVAVPTAWVPGFDPRPRAGRGAIPQVEGAMVQANLNQVFVVCAGRVGVDDGIRFLGSSTAVSPYGEALVGPLRRRAEDVVVVELDVADARRARSRGERIDPRAQRRTDVYDEWLGYRGTSV